MSEPAGRTGSRTGGTGWVPSTLSTTILRGTGASSASGTASMLSA